MKKYTFSILTKFTLFIVVFIFTACAPKTVGLAENATLEEIKKEIITKKEKYQVFSWSAYYGKIDNVKYFIDQGLDVNYNKADEMYDFYPVIVAASYGNHLDIVKLLVKNGADINMKDRQGDTAISLAAFAGYLDIVKYLAEQGASLYASSNSYTGSVLKTLKNTKNEYMIPILLKIQENKKLNQETKKLENKKKIKKAENLTTIEKQKEQIDNYIKNKDFKSLKNYTDKYPNSVNFISQAELRLALTGPKGMKVGDIRKLILRGMDEKIIISLIKRVKVPYKEFTIEEIDFILEMGINSNIVSSMIDVTTELLKDEQKRKQQEYFLNEQKKIAKEQTKVIYQNTKTQKVDAQGNPIVEKLQDELIKQGVGMLLDQLF